MVAIGTSDISHIGGAIDITARGTGSLVAVVTVTVILLLTSVPLGLVVVLGVPLLMAVVSLLIRPLHKRQQAYREQQGKLTGRAGDLVSGLRVLRGVGGEDVVSARYRAESQTLRAAGVRTARVEALLEAAQVLLPGAFLVLVTWLGARFALDGRITVGQLVSFYGYAAFLVAPLRQLTETIDKLTRGHVVRPPGGRPCCGPGPTCPSTSDRAADRQRAGRSGVRGPDPAAPADRDRRRAPGRRGRDRRPAGPVRPGRRRDAVRRAAEGPRSGLRPRADPGGRQRRPAVLRRAAGRPGPGPAPAGSAPR